MEIPSLRDQLVDSRELRSPKTEAHIAALKQVYGRISAAAKIKPALIVCTDMVLNATAQGDSGTGFITFYTAILELLNGKPDEIAAVMAHEFSHLLLDHNPNTIANQKNIARWAQSVARDQYRRTGNVDQAVQLAKQSFVVEKMRYSREVEREADDKGFSLAVNLAKFSADGFKDFARKLSKLPASGRPAYLGSHPGWAERYEKADLLSLNQRYLTSAQELYAKKEWPTLTSLVDDWLSQVPVSGAAWYYRGRILARTSKSPVKISRAFEEAASFYTDNTALGVRSQEDQVEADDVWWYLCLALFDEGYKVESANCSRRISDEKTQERFRAATFGGLLIVGGEEQTAGSLLVARQQDGSKLFTSDTAIAASRGAYRRVSPTWKAIRYPEQLPR